MWHRVFARCNRTKHWRRNTAVDISKDFAQHMQAQDIRTTQLPNGLTLVMERMPDVRSAAFSMLIPAGNIYDPPGQEGCAAVLSDLITRGAGDRNSQQLAFDLDNLGLQRSESASGSHLGLSGATIADRLPDVLRIYADIVLRPQLPADQFDAARAGIAQSLHSIEDEPRQKAMQELRRRSYPSPWGLPSDGNLEGLSQLTADTVRTHYENCFRPSETILGIAGNFDVQAIQKIVEECFGEWPDKPAPTVEVSDWAPNVSHIAHESTQTHIGVAYESVPYRDEGYYNAWAAVNILGGGMSSRLFTEVREKRGLCYSVYASLSALRDQGRVFCYAGSTNERAQETLDVMLAELQRLPEGIKEGELERCKAGAKSSLIMQQESSSSRASAVARDWYHLGRVTTLDEVHQKVDALTVPSILKYVDEHPADNFTVLTLGPESLEVNLGVS
ncbi:Peptidase M16 inactive domain protein [Symmachiella dynata]|uniref:Peptidase M16 inactive domain protein n=2 Tax=Symmachiella dynata TaxID=2527995 RepID=A0A517ZRA8_9PLAN|nr:Peptidase M16 inactive domain protein [Symmachiella dynata]